MYKLDLHTHALGSVDASLTEQHYATMLQSGKLDYIAVTAHNSIQAAQALQKNLGKRIIVGEEITAQEGEIIGLYLSSVVTPGLPAAETVAAIHRQGGLVYIPHPFETIRKGVPLAVLNSIAAEVDIVEAHNGRAVFQNRSAEAIAWAQAYHKPMAASSDAHGWYGWGRTYSLVDRPPTAKILPRLLETAKFQVRHPGIRGLLYPKFNRIRHAVRHG